MTKRDLGLEPGELESQKQRLSLRMKETELLLLALCFVWGTTMSDNRNDLRQEREELAEGESELLSDLKKGALAGLIATIPVAFLAVVKQVLDLIPQLNLIGILTGLTSIPWNGAGWLALFVVGALLGVGFAALDSHVSDTTTVGEMLRGAFYGFLLAVILMVILIPLYGQVGTLGFALGLVGTCIVFGAVMGIAYERMKPEHVT
jgi:hypothetical protein